MRVVQTKVRGEKDIVVFVNKEEAVRIIKSLAHQMMMKSSNTGREEFYTEDVECFTIAVKEGG